MAISSEQVLWATESPAWFGKVRESPSLSCSLKRRTLLCASQRLGGVHDEANAQASEQLGSAEARLQQSQLMIEQVCPACLLPASVALSA